MTDISHNTSLSDGTTNEDHKDIHFDRRRLTYATTFNNPWLKFIIQVMEWCTGKLTILRWIRTFESKEQPTDYRYWRAALDVMGIPLRTPQEQLDNIPETGPVIVVANHPHGMIDGMVMCDLIGRRRIDYKVLTRSVLVEVDEVAVKFLIPVPFPHDPEAQRKSVKMRADAMAHLKAGGVVGIFPAGVVSTSKTWFGPAVEDEWAPFTAKMMQRSGATVVPVHFNGQNSRWYQLANLLSPVLRQGLLLHEIVAQRNTSQSPTIGKAISPEETAKWAADPRGFMAGLRDHTLGLSGPKS